MRYLKIKVYDTDNGRYLSSTNQSDKFIWRINENGKLDIWENDGNGGGEHLKNIQIISINADTFMD